MQSAFRYCIIIHARVHGSHNGCSADGVGALAKPQRVANYSAMLGSHAAEWRNRTGKIMRLAFDGHHPVVIKLDPACVIFEHRYNQGMLDALRRLGQSLEQAQTLPRGVVAMIAPRLN